MRAELERLRRDVSGLVGRDIQEQREIAAIGERLALLAAQRDAIPGMADGYVQVPVILPPLAVSQIKDTLHQDYQFHAHQVRPLWARLLQIVTGISVETQEDLFISEKGRAPAPLATAMQPAPEEGVGLFTTADPAGTDEVAWIAVYPNGTVYGNPITNPPPYVIEWNKAENHPLRPLVFGDTHPSPAALALRRMLMKSASLGMPAQLSAEECAVVSSTIKGLSISSDLAGEREPVAWMTDNLFVCIPFTRDRDLAEQWISAGYPVTALSALPAATADRSDAEVLHDAMQRTIARSSPATQAAIHGVPAEAAGSGLAQRTTCAACKGGGGPWINGFGGGYGCSACGGKGKVRPDIDPESPAFKEGFAVGRAESEMLCGLISRPICHQCGAKSAQDAESKCRPGGDECPGTQWPLANLWEMVQKGGPMAADDPMVELALDAAWASYTRHGAGVITFRQMADIVRSSLAVARTTSIDPAQVQEGDAIAWMVRDSVSKQVIWDEVCVWRKQQAANQFADSWSIDSNGRIFEAFPVGDVASHADEAVAWMVRESESREVFWSEACIWRDQKSAAAAAAEIAQDADGLSFEAFPVFELEAAALSNETSGN